MDDRAIGSAFVELNRTRLHVEVTGADSAPAIVFVHGFSLDMRMWDEQVPAFADHYRLVRYDLRGFGRSAVPEAGVAYNHSDDLLALLDALGIERAVLVGLSMGGAVALDVALTYPDRVRALVLAASVLPGFETPDFDALVRPVWRAGRTDGVAAARSLWLGNPLFKVSNEHPPTRESLQTIVADYSGWNWTDREPGTWLTTDAHSHLAQISAPSLVVVGERDIDDMQRMADALAEGIPGARKLVLPGLGHVPNMEDPAAFNDAVSDFLGVLPR